MKKIIAFTLTVIFMLAPFAASSYAEFENTHKNTGDMAADIVAVAWTQVGYMEGRLDGTVQGSNDCTKYGEWYGLNYQPWCAMFVSWCANQAGVPVSIIPRHASCDSGMNWFKDRGRWKYAPYYGGNYTPKSADVIYFGYKYKSGYDATHVGIVYKTENGKVYVLEGNSSARVQTVSYKMDSSYILGYGVPAYTVGGSTDPYPLGTYRVTASSLYVRNKPGVDGSDTIGLKHAGEEVEVLAVENEYWGKILLSDGTYGWLSLRYCEVISVKQDEPQPDPPKPETTYTLTFDANGGKDAPKAVTGKEGSTVKIPSGVPKRDGYGFLGWSASPAAQTADTFAGESVKLTADVKYYAVWETGETSGIMYLADLNHKAWYYTAVKYCYDNLLMEGTSLYSFSPTSEMTRGALVTVLGKIFILRGGSVPDRASVSFPDVPDGKYYTKYVEWAKGLGIVEGDQAGRFIPNGSVTREQLALILMRAASALGIKSSKADLSLLDRFSDRSDCSGWAVEGLGWACANGILEGSSSGEILPRSPATRAQVAQMIYRFTGN